MNRFLHIVASGVMLAVLVFAAAGGQAQTGGPAAPPVPAPPVPAPPPPAAPPAVLKIIKGVSTYTSPSVLQTIDAGKPATLRLNDDLAVVLSIDDKSIDASKVTLVLDGRAITDLHGTRYDAANKAMVFHLERNSTNADAWRQLLAPPTFNSRSISVSLWMDKPLPGKPTPTAVGVGDIPPSFELQVVEWWSLLAGAAAALLVAILVGATARKTSVLKDSMLPQLAPDQQTFSLARSQMAFWFALIFAAYVSLYLTTWDYNTLTPQALILMGLSGATAVFSVAIDVSKDTPIGLANETLRAIGINAYTDVQTLRSEVAGLDSLIDRLKAVIKATPPPHPDGVAAQAQLTKAQQDRLERNNKLRTWADLTAPFVTKGWFNDVITDINGPALHRLQIFAWTLALGSIFVIEVYRTLTLPQFADWQLGLMGITSAGYLGFKFPEKQN